MFREIWENVHRRAPLIHCMTNFVTAKDCANLLLACGASPVMAEDAAEAEEITAACDGLVLNTGTLSRQRISAMLAAGARANALGHPVVLDPAGAGISSWRRETIRELLNKIRFSVIRGNATEIRALSGTEYEPRGVDAGKADRVTEENLKEAVKATKEFAKATGSVIVVTGAIDLAADAGKAYCIRGGSVMLGRITGAGCRLSALTAACAAANPGEILTAAAAAAAALDLCGEQAERRMTEADGNASYDNYVTDAVWHLTAEALEKEKKIEVR